ncbi:hypothetical protein Tco_0310310, partial [Tanacetum coccineum]
MGSNTMAYNIRQVKSSIVKLSSMSITFHFVLTPSEDPFGLEDLILKSSKKRNVKDVKESTVIPSNSDIPAKDGAKQ